MNKKAFTLLEILLAVSLMALICTSTFMSFNVVIRSWQAGTKMSESLNRGDFIMDQLVKGLRSAYTPNKSGSPDYGFILVDNGEEIDSADSISWVKIGPALVGRNSSFAETPHRVVFTLSEDEDFDDCLPATIKAWQIVGLPDDFDEEDDIETTLISRDTLGFNCRVKDPEQNLEDELVAGDNHEIEWLDEWENSNSIPELVEVTLFLKPAKEGDEPMELKRLVSIPIVAKVPDDPEVE
jgi:hypothetical protein